VSDCCWRNGALTDLAGPSRGQVRLPSSLEWSSDRAFDLGDDSDLRLLYETVLREARDAGDLARHLDAELLISLWPRLWLPPQVRRAWESPWWGRAAVSSQLPVGEAMSPAGQGEPAHAGPTYPSGPREGRVSRGPANGASGLIRPRSSVLGSAEVVVV